MKPTRVTTFEPVPAWEIPDPGTDWIRPTENPTTVSRKREWHGPIGPPGKGELETRVLVSDGHYTVSLPGHLLDKIVAAMYAARDLEIE